MKNTLIKNYFLSCSIMAVLCYSGSVLAMEHYPEDLESSKKNSLMSGIPFSKLDATGDAEKKGVMTLCFNDDIKNTALVFEMFYPEKPEELYIRMIEYRPLCLGKYELMIHPPVDALIKAYRAKEVKMSGRIDKSPEYTSYAAWLIPNNKLIEGLEQVEEDQNKKFFSSYNSTTYAIKIMEAVGLKNIDLGWWFKTPDNLKHLVDRSVQPPVNVTRDNLPRHR